MELIKQGAEARLYLTEYNGNKCIVKERFVKKYRHPELEKQITKERMKAESKAIERCTKIDIITPKLYHMDLNERKLYIEYIENNQTVKDYIKNLYLNRANSDDDVKSLKLKNLCKHIGITIGKMHSNHIIHGDLTTSNMLIRMKIKNNPEQDKKNDVHNDDDDDDTNVDDYDFIMIDFGLSHYSQSNEDKGVDLYVLERALLSTHSDLPELFKQILESYKENYEKHEDVIGKFEEVRARGRKRTMIG